ncbi:MAG: hypothetical protein ACRYFU_21940, partial [Janthinobacterium lividum]
SGAAFFLGPVWFFYRKMWAYAWGLVALYTVLAFLPSGFGSRFAMPLALATGLFARSGYVIWATIKMELMWRPDGALDPAAIARVGGVSKRAGWISGVIFGVGYVATIAGLIYAVKTGVPVPR